MRKEKNIYHSLFKKTTAFKLTLFVVFIMFFNMLNLSFLVAAEHSYQPSSKYIMELEGKLGKIYGAVNLPIHIVNDIFKKEMAVSGVPSAGDALEEPFTSGLVAQGKSNQEKPADMSFGAIFSSGLKLNKSFSKNILPQPGVLYEYADGAVRCCAWDDTVRYALLFLLLLLALPRGIPLINIKNKNILFYISRLYLK